MYSQHKEEKVIVDFFGDYVGSFLDIGAYDGKCFSNIHKLAQLGWSGICIEPSPSVFPALQKMYIDNNKVKTIQIALGSTTGLVDMYDSGGDAISTFVESHKILWEKQNSKFTKVQVEMMNVADFFSVYGYDFDFINIDVEAMDLEIFKLLPFDLLKKTKLICIEHDGYIEEMKQISEPFGYTQEALCPGNLFLSRKI